MFGLAIARTSFATIAVSALAPLTVRAAAISSPPHRGQIQLQRRRQQAKNHS
jgi:hypothetical protein